MAVMQGPTAADRNPPSAVHGSTYIGGHPFWPGGLRRPSARGREHRRTHDSTSRLFTVTHTVLSQRAVERWTTHARQNKGRLKDDRPALLLQPAPGRLVGKVPALPVFSVLPPNQVVH